MPTRQEHLERRRGRRASLLPLVVLRLSISVCISCFCSAVAMAAPVVPLSFESNWDGGCTGNDDACVRDGNHWDSRWCSPKMLEVLQGGSGGVPNAPTGDHVLRIPTNGEECDGISELQMLDLNARNHYFRFYQYINCDYTPPTIGGLLVNHGFQDDPELGGTSENFYFRDRPNGFPGPAATLTTGFSSNLVSETIGDCRSNGKYAGSIFGLNDQAPPFAQVTPCGRWIRKELWIECPDDDACLKVPTGTDVAVRIHFRDHEIPAIGTATPPILRADDDDYLMAHYDCQNEQIPPFGTPRSFADHYAAGVHDSCVAINGGHADFAVGVSGQPFVAEGLSTLYWIDSFGYYASDTDAAWVGPDCEAEPGAPECAAPAASGGP